MPSDDGGPAFPHEGWNEQGHAETYSGMSLHDWYAGMALQGLAPRADECATEVESLRFNEGVRPIDMDKLVPPIVARHCYQLADAMIAERNSRKEPHDDDDRHSDPV